MKSKRTDKPCSRSAAIEKTAIAFSRAVADDGRTRAVIAAEMGVSVTMLDKWGDPQSGARVPSFAFGMLNGAAFVGAIGEMLDGSGHAVVELPAPDAGAVDMRALAAMQRAASDTLTTSIEAFADGHVTRSEGAAIGSHARRVVSLALGLVELAKTAQREGVIGVPTFRGEA